MSQRDRILLFDLGVRNALLGVHRSLPTPIDRGRLFEHWLILQCLSYVRAHRLPWRLSAYRTDAGAEVDLLIDTRSQLLAIECKLGRNVTSSQLTGLRSFASGARRPVRAFVVFQGERSQRFDGGIEAIPYRRFLLETLPELAEQGAGST